MLVGLEKVERELQSLASSGKSHDDLMELLDRLLVQIKKMTDPNLIAEEYGATLDQFERNIRLVTLHKEVAVQLGQRRAEGT